MSTIALVPVPRDAAASPGQQDRARYVERLREAAAQQLDFFIDGTRLSDRLRRFEVPEPETYGLQGFDFLSVADLVWPAPSASALRQLAGIEERPRTGRWHRDAYRYTSARCAQTLDAVL